MRFRQSKVRRPQPIPILTGWCNRCDHPPCPARVRLHLLSPEMEPLPRIPIPFGARWNRWRWRLTHAVVFLGLCGGIGLFWRLVQHPAVFVGQVEALHTMVSSRDDGFITNIW